MTTGTEWPELHYEEWSDTFDTLHMVLQIVGKVRVALSPKEPEWAHIVLYVSGGGLATGPVPSNIGLFDVEIDVLHHEVVIRTADGEAERVALRARPVAEFWADFTAALRNSRLVNLREPTPPSVVSSSSGTSASGPVLSGGPFVKAASAPPEAASTVAPAPPAAASTGAGASPSARIDASGPDEPCTAASGCPFGVCSATGGVDGLFFFLERAMIPQTTATTTTTTPTANTPIPRTILSL